MPPLPVRTLWVVGWRGSWPEKVSRPDQLLGKVNPWFSMLDLTYGEGAALVRAARALGYLVETSDLKEVYPDLTTGGLIPAERANDED